MSIKNTPSKADSLLRKFKLNQFPEPEYIWIDRPILLCHGYGALASLLNKKSPLFDVCMLLRRHGIISFAPNVVPYATIETRAENWVEIIKKITQKTHSQKLHIIAHSMGGLDIRYACHELGLCKYIASVTTIATPHHGASLADFTLNTPNILKNNIAALTDWLADYMFPDKKSDTNGALYQLSTEYINTHFNNVYKSLPDIPCFSYSAAVGKGTNQPINTLLKYQNGIIYDREGINDGFVSVKSARWGHHLNTVNLSHLEQIKMNISKDRIPLWEEFWLGVIKTLSSEIG